MNIKGFQAALLTGTSPFVCNMSALGMLEGGEDGNTGGGGGGSETPTPSPTSTETPTPSPSGDGDPWYAGAVQNDELKTWMQNKGYTDLETTIAAHRGLEQKLGAGRFNVPADVNDTEGWKATYKALGLPDSPDAYKFELAEGADPAFSQEFAKFAHEAGILPHQAVAAQKWFDAQVGGASEAQAAAQKDRVTSEIAELKGSSGWGDKFEANDAIAGAAAKQFGIDGAKMQGLAQAFGAKGALEFLFDLGKKMGEDPLEGGGAGKLGGMTGPMAAEAKKTFTANDEKVAKLRAGDPAAKAEWAQINAALAAELDRADAQ